MMVAMKNRVLVAGVIVILMAIIGLMFDNHKIEGVSILLEQNNDLLKSVRNNLSSLRNANSGGLAFRDVFRSVIQEHDNFQQDHGLINDSPIREYEPFRYTTNETLKYRVSEMQNLSVGEEGTFTVNTDGLVLSNSNLEFVRVLFYGIAIFCPQEWTSDVNGVWTARFHVLDPGLYRVYIESVFRMNRTKHLYRAIEGSPFTILVRPQKIKAAGDASVLASMPHHELPGSLIPIIGSVNYPKDVCPDAHWRTGRWLRCHHTPEPCIRTGWVWVPEACHFRIFRSEELQQLPSPLWIVFAGTSIHRGGFLSAADMLLGHRAANLTADKSWRCWGWLDVTFMNLRLSYIDFRFHVLLLKGDTVPKFIEPLYSSHVIQALRELGVMDSSGPDAFYLEVGGRLVREK
jgi:hypothetical protein